MTNSFRTVFLAFLILAGSKLAAQSLQGLQENPVIKKYLTEKPNALKSAAAEPTLSLPFFEDFSIVSVFPDPEKWADQSVFINSSFALDPMSIGVATFDGIDENGTVYAISNQPTPSDQLTTYSFDLSPYANSDDAVRLSFFYQCGGKGEVPELSDSLILDFFSPVSQQWELTWFATRNTASEFQQVIIIVDTLYYHNGFRFRFRNYTSISPDDVSGGEGALSNADCWNIDYIQMNTAPISEHLSIHDVALIDLPRNLMDFYESIPWLHLDEAQNITRNNLNFVIRNLAKNDTFSVVRDYYLHDLNTGYIESYVGYLEKVDPDTIIWRPDWFYAPFTYNSTSDEGLLEVVGYLDTSADQFKQNDTVKTILHFKDYYAYDDGTPEYGFGISGPSMSGALLAMRFRVYKPDTLRAIDMAFNNTRNNVTADQEFQFCVWKDGGGKPGELLFLSDDYYHPDTLYMPGFKRYPLETEEDLIITDTTIYIGWKQRTEDFLNVGYDVNRDNLPRTFVNVSGTWFNPGGSIIPGTIMMRAVFGGKDVITGKPEIPADTDDIILYPNPVSGMLTIQSEKNLIRQISIFDISGRLLIQENGNRNNIDVSQLSPGIYQVVMTTGVGHFINRKIIVSH
jgi:hypothetical protein